MVWPSSSSGVVVVVVLPVIVRLHRYGCVVVAPVEACGRLLDVCGICFGAPGTRETSCANVLFSWVRHFWSGLVSAECVCRRNSPVLLRLVFGA